MKILIMEEHEKPPSNIRNPTSSGVHPVVSNGRTSWLREMVSVWGISSPVLSSRLRNDMAILETPRGGK